MKMPDFLRTCLVCKQPVAQDAPDRRMIEVNIPLGKVALAIHKGCIPTKLLEGESLNISMSGLAPQSTPPDYKIPTSPAVEKKPKRAKKPA